MSLCIRLCRAIFRSGQGGLVPRRDQLFNLMAGRVIQPRYGQKPQDIMTFEMLEGTDGRKMSSSWGNFIAIDDSPEDMFGKVMSLRDELIARYFLLCTDVSEEEIREITGENTNPRDSKARLAKEIVALYHGEEKALRAAEEFDAVFKDKELPSDIEEISVDFNSADAVSLLVLSEIISSKSEARRLIEQGGFKVDGEKITDSKKEIGVSEEGIVVQVGKRKFAKIKKG